MLLGSERTGSNLLESLLNNHPDILCLGEVFKFGAGRSAVRFKKLAALEPAPAIQGALLQDPRLGLDDPFQFIRVARAEDAGPLQVVGFRVFYNHLPGRMPWFKLRFQPGLHVVHLVRHNLLAQLYSLQRALKTQVWVVRESPQGTVPVEIPYDKCRRFFEKRSREVSLFRRLFAGRRYFELSFEHLVNPEKQPARLEALQQFLGLSAKPLVSSHRRLNTTPLPRCIANYDELRARFQGTRWAELFPAE